MNLCQYCSTHPHSPAETRAVGMYALLVKTCLWAAVLGWDLHILLPPEAEVSRVCVWQTRAFLSVPRRRPGVRATLIAAPWPPMKGLLTKAPRAYPSLDVQQEGGVATLQSVTAVAADALGHLFALDAGLAEEDAKILVYDLWTDKEITRSILTGVSTRDLRALALDVSWDNYGPRTRAFIGDPGDGTLIVYSLRDRRWWTLDLRLPRFIQPGLKVTSTDMTTSRGSPYLYVTSHTTDQLFGVDLKAIRDSPPPVHGKAQSTAAQVLGSKLGPSTGLAMDLADGLHYFLPRFHAWLRWDSKKPLLAEYHSVLLQSADILPTVNDIFVDPHAQVWAVVNQTCLRIQNHLSLPGLDLLRG